MDDKANLERRRLVEQRREHAADESAAPQATPEPAPRRRRPPAVRFETWIDRQIREAQEQGLFDNLRGKGKPLPPEDPNAVFAGDQTLGLKLLKDNEGLPAWIELNKEIIADQDACRRILDHYTAERDRDRRARFAADYRRRATALNAKIDHFNLIVPAQSLTKIRVQIELELRDADRRRWAALDAEDARRQSAS